MNISLLDIRLLLDTVPDLESPALVICAVGARHQLLVLALEGEPRLQIKLLRRRVVQRTGDDGNNPVRQAQALVELLGRLDHRVKRLPRLLGVGEEELLNLLELVHAENAPSISAVAASFSPVAGGVTGVFDGHILGSKPLVGMESRDGLFRSRNEVLVVLTIDHLVQLLVELLQLCSLRHVVLQHELRCL